MKGPAFYIDKKPCTFRFSPLEWGLGFIAGLDEVGIFGLTIAIGPFQFDLSVDTE